MSDIDQKNEQRWARFKSDPDYQRVVDQVHVILGAGNLGVDSIGETWGLTVHVDKETFLRVNHADYALFDIRDPHLPLEERRIYLAVLKDEKNKPSLFSRALSKFAGARSQEREGFTQQVPGSEIVVATFYDLQFLTTRADILDGISRHVQARPRKIFPSRHNPHSVEIFA